MTVVEVFSLCLATALGGVPIFAQSLLKVYSKFGLNLVPTYGQAARFAPRFAYTTKYFLVRHQQIFGLKANFGQTLEQTLSKY